MYNPPQGFQFINKYHLIVFETCFHFQSASHERKQLNSLVRLRFGFPSSQHHLTSWDVRSAKSSRESLELMFAVRSSYTVVASVGIRLLR